MIRGLHYPGAEDSLWHATAPPAPERAPLAGDARADVAVVGGGLTGVRVALGLAEAGVDVALAEAGPIGWGASGRSGGQANPIWRATPDELRARLGAAAGDRLVRATLASADALFDDVRRHGVDCDAHRGGWAQVAHGARAAAALERLGAAWRREGARIEPLDAAAVRARTGSPAYVGGLLHPGGGHVQPLAMTRGFARAAEAAGARLHERTPVEGLERRGGRWRLRTPGGRLDAERVVLATNAYTRALHASLARSFLPMVSILAATAPLTGEARETVLPGGVTLSDTRRAILYGRLDRDGRLVFGCIGSAERAETLGGLGRLLHGLRRTFPVLAGVPVEHRWGGRIAMTPDLMPHLHEPEPGLTAALGYSGRGIVNTALMARTVVRRLLGAPESELAFPVTSIAAVPAHALLVRALPLLAPALALRDRLDRR